MRFGAPVKPGGYAWWYVDAISDDGDHALTCIAFIGSVFSPYYAWANRKALAEPENFCAMNVALYGRGKAWAMTERGKRFLRREENFLQIGPSSLRWDDGVLRAEIDEVTVPVPSRLLGGFSMTPVAIQEQVFTLSAAGGHLWQPIAPGARIEVAFKTPKLSWSGNAYFDRNEGGRGLAKDFLSWQWSRASGAGGTAIFYDTVNQDGTETNLGLKFSGDGRVETVAPPPFHGLKNGFWGVRRRARSAGAPRLVATLEDAPFYLRSQLATVLDGVELATVHESLNLRRLTMMPVPLMLPFRMPRRG